MGGREACMCILRKKIDFCFFTLFAVLVLIKRSSRPRVVLYSSIIKGVFFWGGGGREGGGVLLYIASEPCIIALISCIECSSSIYSG